MLLCLFVRIEIQRSLKVKRFRKLYKLQIFQRILINTVSWESITANKDNFSQWTLTQPNCLTFFKYTQLRFV